MDNEVLVQENTKSNSFAKSIILVIYHILKRTFDIVCSLFGCIFLIPIAIFIKIASILSKDFNSIFYSQKRIGENGKIFKLYKFRSMVPNADEILKEILAEDGELAKEYKINKKMENDPRITKVGKILRKTSLDELPQLINILRGDMSFIGNRPYLPREKEDMGIFYDDIIKTRPGLTGYWQVSGRSNTTFNERLELEKYYSDHCDLFMDIKIFFKTIYVVLFSKGAK